MFTPKGKTLTYLLYRKLLKSNNPVTISVYRDIILHRRILRR